MQQRPSCFKQRRILGSLAVLVESSLKGDGFINYRKCTYLGLNGLMRVPDKMVLSGSSIYYMGTWILLLGYWRSSLELDN